MIGVILVVLNNASTVYSIRDLPQPSKPIDVSSLTDLQRAPDDPKLYHVWHAHDGEVEGVPKGKYLVDDAGKIRYLVDPGINGNRSRRDNGEEVQKFDAPKAVLMANIVEGILNPKVQMPWALVLLGVFIAIVLEMCGVSSLPFAVGVYLPLSTSTPILAGGLLRWVVDRRHRAVAGRAASEAESESSPGVLLSTGFIAGGTIAGVVVAFLSFNSSITNWLGQWQYRQIAVSQAATIDGQIHDLAVSDLGLNADSAKTHAEEVERASQGDSRIEQSGFAAICDRPGRHAIEAARRNQCGRAETNTVGRGCQRSFGKIERSIASIGFEQGIVAPQTFARRNHAQSAAAHLAGGRDVFTAVHPAALCRRSAGARSQYTSR